MVGPLHPSDPTHIGPYRLDGRLGAGGMGQVYLGVSPSGRQVAVKLIRAELAAAPQFRARFAREVEAARRVGGFHTAQVVDADPDAVAPWLVAAYIPGPTLHQVVDRHGPLEPDAVLRLGAGLAEGLAAIHGCGLVHRDLKPGNVIIAEDGPRIIDFGIAHALGAEPMTRAGAVIGTYSYMSPEQIRAAPASPAGDVFSLGSVLGFAATGHSPFEASTVPAIVHRVTGEPPRLGRVEGDLLALLTECLAKDPDGRPSAAAVLDRLSVTGTAAAPKTLPRRALVLGGIAAATTAVAVPTYLFWPDSSAKARAGAAPSPGKSSVRDTTKPVARFAGHTGSVECLAFSPDGKTLASGGYDNTLRLWNAATGRTLATYEGHTSIVMSVVYSPDGRTLFTGGFDRTLRRWDVRTGAPRGVFASYTDGEFDSVGCLAISPDGTTLAVGVGSRVQLMKTSTGRSTATLTGHTGSMNAVAFSPDGKTLASVAADTEEGTVRFWDARTGKLIRTFTAGGRKNYSSVMFSPDGRTLAGAGPGVRLWDLATGRLTATLTDRHPYILTAAYRPDGAVIAGAGGNIEPKPSDTIGKTISLWDPSTGRVATTLTGIMPKSALVTSVSTLAFSLDGKTLAAALRLAAVSRESDVSIQLWKLP